MKKKKKQMTKKKREEKRRMTRKKWIGNWHNWKLRRWLSWNGISFPFCYLFLFCFVMILYPECNPILRPEFQFRRVSFYPATPGTVIFDDFSYKYGILTWSFVHQKKEETAEGAKEAEREGGTKDGSAWCLHRRWWRLVHVLPEHHQ